MPLGGVGMNFLPFPYQQRDSGIHTFPLSNGHLIQPGRSELMEDLVLYQGESEWLQDHCMQVGDAYLIVYSITDRASFEKASELRIQLRRARQTEDIPIILVGNKSDLVRCREVSVSGKRSGASTTETSLSPLHFASDSCSFLKLKPEAY